MPRIPQGEFATTPSSRVGSANIGRSADAVPEVINQLSNLTGAMAQLQDQTERADAYAYANDVKSRHQQRKLQYGAALETVNGSGTANYIDPRDTNPDPAKRKKIQRPIGELYKEMVDSYEEDKKGLDKVERADISGELMRGYVGDDLMEMQLQTDKHLNRVRTKETSQRATDNIQLHFARYKSVVADPGTAPDRVKLEASKMRNSIARELGTVSNIIGTDGVTEFRKLVDREAATTANQLISMGVNNSSILAADELIMGIRNPAQRLDAQTTLEHTKRVTATVKTGALLNGNETLTTSVDQSAVVSDPDYVRGISTAMDTLNSYIHPASGYTDKHKVDSATKLTASLLSNRLTNQMSGEGLSFLNEKETESAGIPFADGFRNPAGGREERMNNLRQRIDLELEQSGISRMAAGNPETLSAIREQTIQKMGLAQKNLKDNIPEMVKATGVTGTEYFEKVDLLSSINKVGDASYVSSKERTQFKAAFELKMATEPEAAFNMVNEKLMAAGGLQDGENSRQRALMIDLAGKDKNMAILIPMADAPPGERMRMIESANRFKVVTQEFGVTETMFQKVYGAYETKSSLQSLLATSPEAYSGIKQAILHDASNSVRSQAELPAAIEASIEKFTKRYVGVKTKRDTSTVLAQNIPGGQIDYSQKKYELSEGADEVVSLPMLSRPEKIKTIEKYLGGKGLSRSGVDGKTVTTPDRYLNDLLRNAVTITPDARYPNVHIMQIGNSPIVINGGKVLKVSAEEIIGHGERAISDKKKKAAVRDDINSVRYRR